jgi:hypothetical protein
MGRKKQINALSKCYSLKVSEEQFNQIQALNQTDKAKLNNLVRALINKVLTIITNTAEEVKPHEEQIKQNNQVLYTYIEGRDLKRINICVNAE